MSRVFPRTAERRFPERLVSRAVRIALFGMAVAATTAAGLAPAHAAGVSLDGAAVHAYNIPAGPLGRNLSNFAAQSGVALSFDPALTAGLTSPALSGSYAPRDAIGRLLAGSGLEVVTRADGSYTLKKAAEEAPREGATLPAVQVTADVLGSTTEGTGSYTTGAASTATRLNPSLGQTAPAVQ